MRLSGTKTGAVNQYRGLGNQLWDLAGNRPSLDLPFSETKSLVDATTGTNLIDFTRASSGTYVGSDGLIKTATTNYLLQSESVNNAPWYVNPGVTINPDYSQGAPIPNVSVYRVNYDSLGLNGPTQPLTYVAGQHTGSIYVKGTAGKIIRFAAQTSVAAQNFTLTGEWQQLSISFTATAGGAGFSLSNAGGGTALEIYIAAPQLEQSSTVGEYIPTTSTINSAPRFDHDPTTGESLGLLVEESRTNLITDSSLTTIGALHDSTISSTTETNPEGIDFCQRLLSDAGTSAFGHRVYVAASSANNITVSAFVKKDTHRYVYIGFGGTVNSFTALFDIDPTVTGDRLLGQGGNGTYTNIDAGYQNFPNGWVRIWAVGTTSGIDGTTIGFSPDDSTYNITNWTAAGTEAIFIHGVQYEDNVTFPTSYIPTTTSAVTRAADVASISGSNFSSWYRQDEGTLFADTYSANPVPTGSFAQVFFMFDGTGSNTINIGYLTANASQFRVRTAGNNEANILSSISSLRRVTAGAYAADAAASESGATAVVVSSVTLPTGLNQVLIGNDNANNTPLNGTIRRLVFWPARLPNETLQGITT